MSRLLDNKDDKITNNYGDNHVGIDIVSKNGGTTNIKAHTKGIVVKAVDGKEQKKGSTGIESYGNYVQIKHDGGYYTLYAHLKKDLKVKEGDYVDEGEIIGTMGSSGNATGIHLHFEVRNPNNYVTNPTKYLIDNLPNEQVILEQGLYYRVHLLKENKWLDWVKESTSENPKYYEYAGLYGSNIDGIQIKIVWLFWHNFSLIV